MQYGAKIAEILGESSVWAQYKDQRHDLFIPANNVHSITGKNLVKVTIFSRNNDEQTAVELVVNFDNNILKI